MILDQLLNADPLPPALLVMVLAASSFTSMLLSFLCAKDCGTSDITKTTSPRECQKEHQNKLAEGYKNESKNHPGRTPETHKAPSVSVLSFPEEAKPFYVFNKTVEYSNGSSDVLPARVKTAPTGPNVNEKTSLTKFPLLTAAGQGKTTENLGQEANKDPKLGKRPPLPAMKEEPAVPATNQKEQDEIMIKHLQRVNTAKHFLKELMENRETINVKAKDVCDKNMAKESGDPTQKRPTIQSNLEGKQHEDEFENAFSIHASPISTGWPCQIELIEAKHTTKQVHHHHHHHHHHHLQHQHKVKLEALRNRQTLSPVNPKDVKPKGEIKLNAFPQNIQMMKVGLKPEPSLEKNKTQMCPSDRRRYVSLTDLRKHGKS